jgi:CO/xanthine dehydrogenase FAD-binding subunit
MSSPTLPRAFEDVDCAFPATLAEALEIMQDETRRGKPLAGGTDMMVQWESGVRELPERAVSIKHLPELRGIEETDTALIIGAAVTHMELRRSAAVRQHLPSLAEAAATVGGFQIQTMGTIGGSVANASPAGDLAPSIMITNGHVVVGSARGGEREIPVTRFWTGYRAIDLQPDELIIRFVLPKKQPHEQEGWRKLGPRQAQAISKVMGSYRGSANGAISDFRVAIGSVAPTCVRLTDVETWLEGQPLNAATLDETEQRVAAAIQPIADIRSTAEYRRWVSGRMVRGFLQQLA